MKILITGFDAFNGEIINPTTELVKAIPDELYGHQIIKQILPTAGYACLKQVYAMIDKEKPNLILSFGQAGGRASISLEKVAINLNDFSIPDNFKQTFSDTPIFKDGPTAYFSTLPLKAMKQALFEKGIPCSISYSAGTFVCNHLMYGILHYLNCKKIKASFTFVHVPFLPSQTIQKPNSPSMSLEMMIDAVIEMIKTITTVSEDVQLIGGKIC